MVTAGVYMVARQPRAQSKARRVALDAGALVGVITPYLRKLGLVQTDIKRFSAIHGEPVGYMFPALRARRLRGRHLPLVTHAFSRLLFSAPARSPWRARGAGSPQMGGLGTDALTAMTMRSARSSLRIPRLAGFFRRTRSSPRRSSAAARRGRCCCSARHDGLLHVRSSFLLSSRGHACPRTRAHRAHESPA